MSNSFKYSILADIGGTNARFCIENKQRQFEKIISLPSNNYPTLELALRDYLQKINLPLTQISHIAIAIANPINGDWVSMTNHNWQFSIEEMRKSLAVENLLVTNDFTALAMALPHLLPEHLEKFGSGTPYKNEVLGLMGAGTGLGVSGAIPIDKTGKRWRALSSEGGHVMFSPANNLEIEILKFLWGKYPHLSFERLASGPGIVNIYTALRAIKGGNLQDFPDKNPAQIVEGSQKKLCSICEQTTDVFSQVMGSYAGNLAVLLGCKGGLYIGGGVVLKLQDSFNRELFRKRFEDKGRFCEYVSDIPTYIITAEYPAYYGLSSILQNTANQ